MRGAGVAGGVLAVMALAGRAGVAAGSCRSGCRGFRSRWRCPQTPYFAGSRLWNAWLDLKMDNDEELGKAKKCNSLHYAVANADLEAVMDLLAKTPDVNITNRCGASPLFYAIIRVDKDIVKALLRHGADPGLKAITGRFCNQTPLDLASSNSELWCLLQNHLKLTFDNMSYNLGSPRDTSSIQASYGFVPFSSDETNRPDPSPGASEENLLEDDARCTLPLDTSEIVKRFWPVPQFLELAGEDVCFGKRLKIYVVEGEYPHLIRKVMNIFDINCRRLEQAGYTFHFEGVIRSIDLCSTIEGVIIHINSGLFPNPRDAYSFVVTSSQIRIVAGDVCGVFYGIYFLVRLLALSSKGNIPQVKVMNWPSWNRRGAMLDVTCDGPLLALKSVMDFVDVMANVHLNELFLMTPLLPVNGRELPFTPSEIVRLDRYCRDRCISLTPAFEFEEEFDGLPFNDFSDALTRCLSHFCEFRYIYFGCRVTRYLFKYAMNERSFPPLPVSRQTCLILEMVSTVDRELLSLVPFSICCILLRCCRKPWIAEDVMRFKEASSLVGFSHGIEVPPSLSDSLTGCSAHLQHTFFDLARDVAGSGGTVFLLPNSMLGTTLPSFVFGLPGIAFGAGVAWNCRMKLPEVREVFPKILDVHVFEYEGVGTVLTKLSQAETCLANREPSFAHCLFTQPNNASLEGVTLDSLQKSLREIKQCVDSLSRLRYGQEVTEWIIKEMCVVAEMLLFACRLCRCLIHNGQNPWKGSRATFEVANVGVTNLPATNKTDLANRLLDIAHQLQNVWQGRVQQGGLQKPLQLLNGLLHQLLPADGQLELQV